MKVSYVKSPVGWVKISSKQKVASSKGKNGSGELVVSIEFVKPAKLSRLTRSNKNSLSETKASKELGEYFAGKRKKFSNFAKATLDGELGPPNFPGKGARKLGRVKGTEFQRAVWQEISKIPFGETITYKELAKRVGRPKAIRAAASACGKNPVPVVIPCHRVVGSNGGLGGYSSGVEKKKWLLRHEGILIA